VCRGGELAGGELIGVVPLAVEKGTRRLAFAGDQMADYRDVVARPDSRPDVIRELLRLYRAGRFSNRMFRLGPALPESRTADIAFALCRSQGVRGIRRSHSGWRWWSGEAERAEDPLKKKAVRYALNYFRRRGEVDAEVVRSREDWVRFREVFYLQHSLRQLYGGRGISFDDPRKRAFFDALFDTPLAHVTALRAAGSIVAGHFGCAWKNVLYWGAPSFDIRERQYSPGLLLVVLTMKHARQWGLQGFDLTIGEGDLKERFSTSRAVLPTVDLYSRPPAYYRRRLQDILVAGARRPLAFFGAEALWRKRIRPALFGFAGRLHAARRLGPWRGFAYLLRPVYSRIGGMHRELVFTAAAADLRGNPGDPAANGAGASTSGGPGESVGASAVSAAGDDAGECAANGAAECAGASIGDSAANAAEAGGNSAGASAGACTSEGAGGGTAKSANKLAREDVGGGAACVGTGAGASAGRTCAPPDIRPNAFADLLPSAASSPIEVLRLAATVRKLPGAARSGKDLHTILKEGRLAAWGFSCRPPASHEVLLEDFECLAADSSALALLIAAVLRERFRGGAEYAQLILCDPDSAAREAARICGLRLSRVTTTIRLFHRQWKRTRTFP
jgi:hypothetical protein